MGEPIGAADHLSAPDQLSAKALGALRGIVANQPASETSGRVAIWLWVEDPHYATRAECCTALMAAEVRAMPAHQRRLWLGLLLQADLSAHDRPGKDWLERSRRPIAALGATEFHSRVARWLNAIPASGHRDREPVPLTRLGSHLLKSLVWWSTVSRNPNLDDAVVRLSGVRWARKVRQMRVAGAVALAVARMHEATQIPDLQLGVPEPRIEYLSPIV